MCGFKPLGLATALKTCFSFPEGLLVFGGAILQIWVQSLWGCCPEEGGRVLPMRFLCGPHPHAPLATVSVQFRNAMPNFLFVST